MKAIAAQCFGWLLATEVGGSTASDRLSIVTDLEVGSYVNVDASTPTGTEHVKNVDLPNLPGLNFVTSSCVYEAAESLFPDLHKGRIVSMPNDKCINKRGAQVTFISLAVSGCRTMLSTSSCFGRSGAGNLQQLGESKCWVQHN